MTGNDVDLDADAAQSAEGPLAGAIPHLVAAGLRPTIVAPAHTTGETSHTLLRVTGPTDTQTYTVQEKSKVSIGSAAGAKAAAQRYRPLIVTSYVPETIADAWRSQDIHYVDSVGNMYLRWEGLLVDIRGRRRPTSHQPAGPGRPLRAFKAGGLRILFALLTKPGTAAAPFRDIAGASGVSLGTVQWVAKELEQLGYLDAGKQPRRLRRTRELFNRWVEAYTLNLWPTLVLARFDSPETTWWANADESLELSRAQWGGETAASRLQPHLRPARAVIYSPSMPNDLIARYKLRRAAGEGNVEIRERFWNLQPVPADILVPTPLIYADLIASGDPRQMDAANWLREHDDLIGRIDGS